MKKSRFTETQIIGILKEADSGAPGNNDVHSIPRVFAAGGSINFK